MKTKYLRASVLLMAAGGLVLVSGCVVEPSGRVVIGVPPPVVVEPQPVLIPDDYFWDGYEYVGIVGDQYFYLGPGNVWIVCDPGRLARVHDYIGIHPDWHTRAIRNDRYRTDSHGHYQPRRDDRH